MASAPTPSRRAFMTGRGAGQSLQCYHVSSAVVSVLPDRMPSVMQAIAGMQGAEISAHDGHRIVVVMEAETTGDIGQLLTAIAGLEGVIAANMVFEQIEQPEGA
jgi:nitrate reductase NapD